jgi:phosphoglycerate dehydrogenase-like enzyme
MENKINKKLTIVFLGDLYDPTKKITLGKEFDYVVCEDISSIIDNKENVNVIIVKSPKILGIHEISQFPNLLVISTTGKGFDNVDIEYATKKGILVLNNPVIATTAIVEHTFSMMFGLLKRTNFYHKQVLQNNYSIRDEVRPIQLSGKTLGILGYGKIGQQVSSIAYTAFNMRVQVFDPFYREQGSVNNNFLFTGLEEVLKTSDIISLHAELNKNTSKLLGKYELSIMKQGSYLINTARGGLIDMLALKKALLVRHISAAALDVFEPEPPEIGFFEEVNEYLLLSPHIGGVTDITASKLSQSVLDNVLMAVNNGTCINVLNPEVQDTYLLKLKELR